MDVFMTATRKQEIKYSFLFTKYTNFIMLLNSSKIKLNVRFKKCNLDSTNNNIIIHLIFLLRISML